MLLNIREKTQGWVAYAIVLLISIPFALTGIASYIGIGSEPLAAKVEGEKITTQALANRIQQVKNQYAQQFGDSFSFPDEMIRKQALTSLIERTLIEETVNNIGLRASDDLVKSYVRERPYFQVNGKFDPQSYEDKVKQAGFSKAGYIQNTRKDIIIGQFSKAHEESAFVTDFEIKEKQRLNNQVRDFQFITIKSNPYLEKQTVSSEEITAFYNKNADKYQTDLKLKIAYLDYSVKNLKKQITTPDEDLKAYFEKNPAEFILPERRKTRHILVAVDQSANDSEVKKAQEKAQSLLAQLTLGMDFATLAKEHSDDKGSGAKGGDLGWVEHGMMVKPFEESNFSLELNTISEPIRSQFGFHLIEVTEIDKPEATFDKVKVQVVEAYKTKKATDLYYKLADEVANLASEELDSLEVAANEAGIEIKHSDWLTRKGESGILGNSKVLTKAFDEEFLSQNENSSPIEISDLQTVFIHIEDSQEPGIKPLEDVKKEIETQLKKDKAAVAIKEQLDQWVIELKEEKTTLQALADSHKVELMDSKETKRSGSKQPNEIVKAVFKMAHPQESKTMIEAVKQFNGDMSLVELSKVTDPKDETTIDKTLRLSSAAIIGGFEFRSVVDGMKEQANIEIMEKE